MLNLWTGQPGQPGQTYKCKIVDCSETNTSTLKVEFVQSTIPYKDTLDFGQCSYTAYNSRIRGLTK